MNQSVEEVATAGKRSVLNLIIIYIEL